MKKVFVMFSMIICMMVMFGCGKQSDDKMIQGKVWHLEEISEESPELFPVTTAMAFLHGESFEIEFLSDGSVIINAVSEGGSEYNSEAYYHYSLVDGRLKIVAPLGSSRMVEYELQNKTLKLTDGDNYAIFKTT